MSSGHPEQGGQPREDSPDQDGRSFDWRLLAPLLVILAVVGGAAGVIASGGGGSKSQPLPGNAHTTRAADYRGSVASPAPPEPALALNNYLGKPVNIDSYRGKAVLVTFLYTNCPDVCPLIAANLRVAQNLMGKSESSKVQMIAVSVDPRGDKPVAVATFLKRHGMVGRMQYLIGSATSLARVWKAWNVGSSRDAQKPELVDHSGLVYGISASGKITTLYPANFKPSDIAHDVPMLAAS
jgi:protein SCO1